VRERLKIEEVKKLLFIFDRNKTKLNELNVGSLHTIRDRRTDRQSDRVRQTESEREIEDRRSEKTSFYI
jgi:hypothetical protein